MFMENRTERNLILQGSEIFCLIESILRSFRVGDLSSALSYKHFAALRPGHGLNDPSVFEFSGKKLASDVENAGSDPTTL
jgi:hypothetical protein